jgi:hypothetical protein
MQAVEHVTEDAKEEPQALKILRISSSEHFAKGRLSFVEPPGGYVLPSGLVQLS